MHDARIWTIGHSNRSAEAFVALLLAQGIEQVIDVRRHPGSRRWPQFGQAVLRETLETYGIGYAHLEALGGRRGRTALDSPNSGWRVAQFAAYADHMQSQEFQHALARLMELAGNRKSAIMCAEALPWQCHRRLLADALIVRGWGVYDIMGSGRTEPRELTPFALVRGDTLTYPG
jgi:uncharacterized protein (DUF488 family)